MQVISRGLVRSTLPIHTSGGHRWPSPKISVLHPLPTGVESEHEVATFKLRSFHAPSEVRKQVEPLPYPGLDVLDLLPLSGSSQPAIQEMTFRIHFSESLPESLIDVTGCPDGPEAERTNYGSSLPEALLDLSCMDQTCLYQTGSDGQYMHPESVLDWLENATGDTLPPVRQMIKTDIITER